MDCISPDEISGGGQYGRPHSSFPHSYSDPSYDVRSDRAEASNYPSGIHTHQIHHGNTNGDSRYHHHHHTYNHGGQFDLRSSPPSVQPTMNQDYLYSEDSQRESASDIDSANSTRQVTRIITLAPSRHVMPDHKSYFGTISGLEAENILKKSSKRSSYLTRYSENSSTYVVSMIHLVHNRDEVLHLKLSIDNENSSFSLEGTKKTFSSLNKLLKFYERNTLSSDIRNLGSPCVPPHLQRKESHSISEEDESQSLEASSLSGIKELTTHMLDTLSRQHMEQLKEQRRSFDEKLKEEKDQLRQMIQAEVAEQKRAEELRKQEELKPVDLNMLLEQLEKKQKEKERQKLLEEQEGEEKRKIQELENKLREQAERFEKEQERLEEQRKKEEAAEKKRKAEEDEKIKQLEKKINELQSRKCTIS